MYLINICSSTLDNKQSNLIADKSLEKAQKFFFLSFFSREDALKKMNDSSLNGTSKWKNFVNETYIKEAGWYFKTLAVQEIGEKKATKLHSLFYQ